MRSRSDITAALIIVLLAMAFYAGVRWGAKMDRDQMRKYFPDLIAEVESH